MARPKLDTPNYRLVRRGDRFYVRWWQDGTFQVIAHLGGTVTRGFLACQSDHRVPGARQFSLDTVTGDSILPIG